MEARSGGGADAIAPDARPRLPRGVRLMHNEAQGGWVLLAPERIFKADAIAVEILKRCTGEATLDDDRRRPGQDLQRAARAHTCRRDEAARRSRREEALGVVTWRQAASLTKPLGLLAELTHRCPLGCPYCSNPLALEKRDDELDTATWARVFGEAAELGVLQVHLSGGEPGARRDLVEIAASAREAGLYTNLITSGVGITTRTMRDLWEAGLDHVQVSIQDSDAVSADHIAGYKGAFQRKHALAAEAVRLGLPLTINLVVHRANIERIGAMVDLALGAEGEPDRDRARAVLRLGAEEPRGADADARAGRARGRRSRGTAPRATRAAS